MQVTSINNATSFGKISWGTEEQEKETLLALEAVKKYNIEHYHYVDFSDVVEQLDAISKCEDEVIVSAKVDDDNTRLFTLTCKNPKDYKLITRFCLGLKNPSRPLTASKCYVNDLNDFAKRTISTISLSNQDDNSVINLMDKFAGKES